MPYDGRVKCMLEFMESMDGVLESDDEHSQRHAELEEGGQALLEMDDCIKRNRGKGVLTAALIKNHHQAIDEWLKRADALNSERMLLTRKLRGVVSRRPEIEPIVISSSAEAAAASSVQPPSPSRMERGSARRSASDDPRTRSS